MLSLVISKAVYIYSASLATKRRFGKNYVGLAHLFLKTTGLACVTRRRYKFEGK